MDEMGRKGYVKAKGVVGELREFLMRGNVIDLAVAVVIGAAFSRIVTSFTDNILMQLVAMFGGQPDFSARVITIASTPIYYGAFLNAVVNFLIVGTAMFFVVKLANSLRPNKEDEAEELQLSEVEVLTEIRDLLRERAG